MKQHSSWNGIIAGLMAVCVTLLSPGCVTKSDSSENQTDSVCSVASVPHVEKSNILPDSVNNHPKGHDETWRKENGFLLGQIYDKDGYTNIRAGQSTKTDILGTLSDGERILYKNVPGSNWFDVYDLDGARLGYVHSSRIVSVRSSALPQEEVFTTPDLKWARVQGHVKKVAEIYDNNSDMAETFYFDKTGKFVRLEMGDMLRGDGNMVRRNNAGQIIWMGSKEGNQDKFKYNKDGYVIEWRNSDCDWSTGYDYTVNERGWILTEEEDCSSIGYEYVKGTYNYTKIDGQGNWLQAIVKTTIKDDDGVISTNKSTITRKITYWE